MIADLAKLSSKSKTVVPTKDDRHRSRKWSYADLTSTAERKYLFRDVALEVFFSDGRSYLLIFAPGIRAKVVQAIQQRAQTLPPTFTLASPVDSKLAAPFAKVAENPYLRKATRRWEGREISNFEYLMVLNSFSGRTYNDCTAYPVFPWVVADWESEELGSAENTYRILSLPMGAQTPERRSQYCSP